MTTHKPVTKLPQKMRKNIEITRELVDMLHIIERRYLTGKYSAEDYFAATHDALVRTGDVTRTFVVVCTTKPLFRLKMISSIPPDLKNELSAYI